MPTQVLGVLPLRNEGKPDRAVAIARAKPGLQQKHGAGEMRIAAKRLRYAIELFTVCWGARIAPFAEEIAEMQSFLGEVHDANGWFFVICGAVV